MNPKGNKMAEITELVKEHRKFRTKQRISKAKAVRRKLRAMGFYLSEHGHHAGVHD